MHNSAPLLADLRAQQAAAEAAGPVITVCAQRQVDRSLSEVVLQVESFGVGGHVKLPGPSASQPNIFEFGTPYRDIYKQLKQADAELYSRNGILEMLRRNMDIKTAPERWQDNR